MCQQNKIKVKNIEQHGHAPFMRRGGGKELASEIKELAVKVGYAACGITTAEPFEKFALAIEERINRFPKAAHLYAEMRKRANPCSSSPWAKSIIVCVRRYGKYEIPEGVAGHIGRNYLFDRRHQECPDHSMPKKMVEGLMRMGIRVRKGGVPDRWAGARAGVTRFGKNCFAYSTHGSWINIETWLVDAELPADKPTLEPACPKGCQACIDACPTGALVKPFTMRMDHCIAYLTYEYPEPIPENLWARMGAWVYGCDICQEVCPLNKGAWEPIEKASWLKKVLPFLNPQALARMDKETYRTMAHPYFWYIPMDSLARWHANATRALQCVSMLT